MKTKPSLPAEVSPKPEEKISLDEKLAVIASMTDPLLELELSPGELNALFGRLHPPPAMGLVLEDFWIIPGKDKATFVFEGSGFFFSSLILIMEAESAEFSGVIFPPLKSIQINSYQVTSGFPLAFANWLTNTYIKKAFKIEDEFVKKIEFGEQKIVLTGSLSVFRPGQRREPQ